MPSSLAATFWPLPVPATEENRGALEQHLRTMFKASTPQHRPFGDTGYSSQGSRSARLDRDVRLGVLDASALTALDTSNAVWCVFVHTKVVAGFSSSRNGVITSAREKV